MQCNKKYRSPFLFKRTRAFILLSSLAWGKSLTLCPCTRLYAHGNDLRIVRSRDVFLREQTIFARHMNLLSYLVSSVEIHSTGSYLIVLLNAPTSFKLLIEGVHWKKPQVTLDLMSNAPFLYKEAESNLLRESCSLSDVTQGLFPCTPFISLV